jgi:hypothetical protein
MIDYLKHPSILRQAQAQEKTMPFDQVVKLRRSPAELRSKARSFPEAVELALELIGDKRRWCQGAIAMSENDNCVHFDDPRAVRWCAGGAVAFVSGNAACFAELEKAVSGASAWYKPDIEPVIAPQLIAQINDHQGHAAVCKALKRILMNQGTDDAA